MSVSASAAANPPSHAPDGSQFGSRLVVAPPSRAARNNAGRSAASPGWRKKLPTWTCRARLEQRGRHVGRPRVRDRAHRGEDRAVGAVAEHDRRAGGPARARPGRPTRPRHARASASSVNRPSASSPTTPTIATRSPSRAAPHAVIADELPIVSRMPSTSRSAWPNDGDAGPGR